MRAPRLLRTAAFRLAALYGLLFAGSVLVLMAVTFTLVEGAVSAQIAAAVRSEARALAGATSSRGSMSALSPQGATLRFAQAADGRVLANDIVPKRRQIGPLILHASDLAGGRVGTGDEDDGADSTFIAYGLRLPNGDYVLAAQDDERISETREAISDVFVVVLLVALTMSVAGGSLLSWLYLRRIEGFNRAARAIFDGRIDMRMPVGGSEDELDQLASNLNRMLDRIARLMDAMRQVSDDIAHDLRTPLGRLRQRLERLADPRAGDDGQGLASQALAEADAILDTFGALLSIAQLQSGSAQSNVRDVDLSALMGQVAEIYAPVAAEGGRHLDAAIQPGIAIKGDASLLLQLFANLVENALAHTPQGSRVTLSLTSSPRGWTGAVTDDGEGVPASERHRIFDRFYRLERSRSTPGTGLGLALAKAIAEMHDLELSAGDNHPGLLMTLRSSTNSSRRSKSGD